VDPDEGVAIRAGVFVPKPHHVTELVQQRAELERNNDVIVTSH
jgi:hypothetical protein